VIPHHAGLTAPATTPASPRFYRAEDIEPLHAEIADALEKAAAQNVALAEENAQLKKKAEEGSGQEKVLLQKIAALEQAPAIQVLPEEDINSFLDVLERNDQLHPSNRAKVASALRANPAFALQLAARVSTFSADAHSEGSGLPKDASHDVTENLEEDLLRKERELWAKVASQGA
jgi:hypothetical protein